MACVPKFEKVGTDVVGSGGTPTNIAMVKTEMKIGAGRPFLTKDPKIVNNVMEILSRR